MSNAAKARSAAPSPRTTCAPVTVVAVEVLFQAGEGYDFRLVTAEGRRRNPDAIRKVVIPAQERMPLPPELALRILKCGLRAHRREGTESSRYGMCFVPGIEMPLVVIVDLRALPDGIDAERVRPVNVGGFEKEIARLLEIDALEDAGTRGPTYARAMGALYLAGLHSIHETVPVW